MDQVILSGLAIGATYVLMTLGFALEMEIGDIVNVAHGAFVVGGMYIVWRMTESGVSPYLAVVLAGIAVGIASYLVYATVMGYARAQTGHRAQLVYSLLLLSGLGVTFQLIFGADSRSIRYQFSVYHIGSGVLPAPQAVAIVAAVGLSVGLYLFAKYSRLGKMIYAAGWYQTGARAVGIPVERIYMAVFVAGGVTAGVSGGLIVTFQQVDPFLGLQFTLIAALIAIIARTNLLGCMILGFGYGLAQSLLSYYVAPNFAGTLSYLVLLVALIIVGNRFAAIRVFSSLRARA
jgi:branched-chain amino acid transport system permease protein